MFGPVGCGFFRPGSLRNAEDDRRSMEEAACAVCQGVAAGGLVAEGAGCRVMAGCVGGPVGFVVRVRTGTRWLPGVFGRRQRASDGISGLAWDQSVGPSFGERAGFARAAPAKISYRVLCAVQGCSVLTT